jgi:hypothetical protein
MRIIDADRGKLRYANILFNLCEEEFGCPMTIAKIQAKLGVETDGMFGPQSFAALYNRLLKTVDLSGKFSDYIKEVYPKKQIIWHHSAGWDNARGMIDYWQVDARPGVATAIGIIDDGTIFKAFDEKYWGGSIGCDAKVFIQHGVPLITSQNGKILNNQFLDKGAIAVEVCNWGCLTKEGNQYKTWAGVYLPEDKVIKCSYRGFEYYEKYTPAEIEALKKWTLLMAIAHNIPLSYNHDDMWEVSKKALSGIPGLYTHGSYRWDKNDVYPNPELITMAKSLEQYQL